MKTGRKNIEFFVVVIILLTTISIYTLALGNVVDSGDCSAEGSAVTWTYYDDHTMVISGNGAMSDSYDYSHKWLDFQIEKLIVDEGITHIGDSAFSESTKQYHGVDGVSEVYLPSTLKSIGMRAFEYCHDLETITIPNSVVEVGVYAFRNCSGLKSVLFSENIKTISGGLFSDCVNLSLITNIGNIVEIGTSAFYNCKSLNTIDLPDNGIIIAPYAFDNTAIVNNISNYVDGVVYVGTHIIKADCWEMPENYYIKANTKSIAAYAFEHSPSGRDFYVYLPDSIECVGKSAFKAQNISSLPSNIRYIGDQAFSGCNFLNSIVIPGVVETVGAYAFAYSDIQYITICEGVKKIEAGAFASHSALELYIPSTVEYIGPEAVTGDNISKYSVSPDNQFYKSINGVLFSKDGTKLISYPIARKEEVYKVPSGTTTITTYAFSHGGFSDIGMGLKTIEIPESVVLIENNAFESCHVSKPTEEGYLESGLENIVIENGNRNLIIESEAFQYCYQLKNIVLPSERVYYLSADAFNYTEIAWNPDNWEDGAFYIDDILVGFDDWNYSLPEEYTVKDGTTVIADYANMYTYAGEGGEFTSDLMTKIVDIPESVVIIGNNNYIMDAELPENLERIGSDGLYIDEQKLGELIQAKYKDYINGVELSDSQLYDLFKVDYVYDNWLADTIPYGAYFGITDELCVIDDGIVGLEEGGILATSFAYAKGVILPQSFKSLSLNTSFSWDTLLNSKSESDELSLTFLNKNCEIYDHEETISEIYTICGYSGSTAEVYANKYGRKFVSIDNCNHKVTCKRISVEPSCNNKGRTGDIYCQYCGSFISKGMILPVMECDMTEWKTINEATCTTAGLEQRSCKNCNKEETRIITAKEHNWLQWNYNVVTRWSATCTTDEQILIQCWDCNETKEIVYEGTAKGHSDNNNDGYCDLCNELLDFTKTCSCNCHKGGISGFFFKLVLFFQKIFKINRVCSCGMYHY